MGWQFRGVPRELRMEYGGAIYHVMNRGDRREDIFRDDLRRPRSADSIRQQIQKEDETQRAKAQSRNEMTC